MAEIKIICERPDSILRFITDAITKELQLLADGIRVTEERLREFETQYQFSTQEFLSKFSNDELHHSPDFDEWIGESRMLKRLQDNARELNLPNLPHHKHEEGEENIVASAAPTLAEVLQEIESVNFRSR